MTSPMLLMVPIVLVMPVDQGHLATFRDRENPAVQVRAEISADGTPIRCAVTYNRADVPGADEVCTIVMAARFNRARDNDGRDIAAVYTGWYQKRRAGWVSTLTPEWDQRELTLTVNKLPKGVRDFSTTFLRVVAGADGKVEACDLVSPRLNEATASFFCRQARSVPLPPVRSQDGLAIRSAQLLRVRVARDATLSGLARHLGR